MLVGTYHSANAEYGTTDEVFFKQMALALDVYSYDKFLLAGDFNVDAFDASIFLQEFMDEFHALNLVKEPTCYKNHSLIIMNDNVGGIRIGGKARVF